MVCQETVEPLFAQYKPPGLIKKIYFKNLSFGDAPFKIENAWVEDQGEKHVLLEVTHKSQHYLCVSMHSAILSWLANFEPCSTFGTRSAACSEVTTKLEVEEYVQHSQLIA